MFLIAVTIYSTVNSLSNEVHRFNWLLNQISGVFATQRSILWEVLPEPSFSTGVDIGINNTGHGQPCAPGGISEAHCTRLNVCK